MKRDRGWRSDFKRGEAVTLFCEICGRCLNVIWVRRIDHEQALVIFAETLREAGQMPPKVIGFPRRRPDVEEWVRHDCRYGEAEQGGF